MAMICSTTSKHKNIFSVKWTPNDGMMPPERVFASYFQPEVNGSGKYWKSHEKASQSNFVDSSDLDKYLTTNQDQTSENSEVHM